jgi:hypothetical protein
MVTPTVTAGNHATVKVNGTTVVSGATIGLTLSPGVNPIAVLVTAQNGATNTYLVTVTRATNAEKPAKQEKPASPLATSTSPSSNTNTASSTATTSTTGAADTTFSKTAPIVPDPIKAQLTGPVQNGGTLSGATAAFTWNAGRGVTDYWLSVGRAVGGTDIYDDDQAQALSHTVTVPTDGTDIYVTLHSLINGAWKVNNYIFTAADTTKAVLTTPVDGSVVTADTTGATTFSWSNIPGATNYWLRIGSTEGGTDLYDSTEGVALTQGVTLPTDGRQLFVTLSTNINGQLLDSTSTLTAANTTLAAAAASTASADSGSMPTPVISSGTSANPVPSSAASPTVIPTIAARLTAPTDHVVLTSSPVTFTWDAGSGVSEYWLSIGSSTVATDLYNASQGSNQSVTIAVPIDGSPIYVTISSLLNGQWQSDQYLYQAPLPPR